jgi:hypothetical protein
MMEGQQQWREQQQWQELAAEAEAIKTLSWQDRGRRAHAARQRQHAPGAAGRTARAGGASSRQPTRAAEEHSLCPASKRRPRPQQPRQRRASPFRVCGGSPAGPRRPRGANKRDGSSSCWVMRMTHPSLTRSATMRVVRMRMGLVRAARRRQRPRIPTSGGVSSENSSRRMLCRKQQQTALGAAPSGRGLRPARPPRPHHRLDVGDGRGLCSRAAALESKAQQQKVMVAVSMTPPMLALPGTPSPSAGGGTPCSTPPVSPWVTSARRPPPTADGCPPASASAARPSRQQTLLGRAAARPRQRGSERALGTAGRRQRRRGW